jgi:hypothetical protein
MGSTAKVAKSLLILVLLSAASRVNAQVMPDSTVNQSVKWYDKETIYLRNGNSFVKNNVLYSGHRALSKEFLVSTRGLDLYLRSRRVRTIGLVISVAGSAGSIISLISGNRDNLKTFFWVSVGTGLVSAGLTGRANNLLDEAVWVRNRDAMRFMQPIVE